MDGESVESPRSTSDENRVSILRKAFDVYDADGSGSIDYSEFKRLIQDLGWPAHEEFIDRAVRVLDQDLSGEIEFSEFQKWTEFAYASRILYRQEMYGLGPRSSSVDGLNMQPVVDEAHDGKKAVVIRRTSLTTVFEETGHAEQENQESDNAQGDSRDEEERKYDGRPGLLICSSGSSKSRDRDREMEPSSPFTLQLRSRKSSPLIPFPELDKMHTFPLSRGDGDDDESVAAECQDLAENSEGIVWDGENTPPSRKIDAPIREMATMVLARGRRSRKIHTSRSRAKSVGILRSRRSSRFDTGSYTIENSDDGVELGPRTESKTTVRMRFACGQFEGEEGEENKASSNLSQSCGSEIGEKLRCDELLKREEARNTERDTASAGDWSAGLGGGRDEHGKVKRSVEWEDGDGHRENRETE